MRSAVVVLLRAGPGESVWRESQRVAALATAGRLAADPRVSRVQSLAPLLESLKELALATSGHEELPKSLRPYALEVASADGRTAPLAALWRSDPESHEAMALWRDLRRERWPAAATAGIISSAALITISIFASFGFTRLTATRELGLGLAFAAALDATPIRVVLIPALMVLVGPWSRWLPGKRSNRHG